ncbi:MAG: hypothetical protein A3B38_03830 [Candidatus Levybacteria bacterium RIFCSPLOWO2_01_FULL_36_13]|nr:MAG: hypothetical protein A2684_00765 [Candidatus Levybacteria bacterium RIFCSPHIGHO2_01_FULL_36_15b]OGH34261.1 MAG: hypothetical protein A3B38_03830 [Candidatus Levybacteria bacterium RIFCSPLOWO2_01_FULL_36_13]
MQNTERRSGLRRFIPFIREKKIPVSPVIEEVKNGELNIPADAYSKAGTVEAHVVTKRFNGEWKTTVNIPDYGHRVVGVKNFAAESLEEALKEERSFMKDKTGVEEPSPIEFNYGDTPLEKRIVISDYSQRIYTLKKKN